MTIHDEEEGEGNFWTSVNKLSRNPDRPKRNSKFLLFLFGIGCVGVVVFAILAVLTINSRNTSGCLCANPYRIVGNGDKILDTDQCFKDMTYMACYDGKTKQYTMYAGLAGGSGGLLIIALLLFRYG